MIDEEAIKKCRQLDQRHTRALRGHSNPFSNSENMQVIIEEMADFWLKEITEEQAEMLLARFPQK